MGLLDDDTQKAYDKLLDLRARQDLTIKPNQYLRSTIRGMDGQERPLQLRYYQIQMVMHLVLMNRFVVGDDMGLGKCKPTNSLVATDQGLRYLGDLIPKHVPADSFGDPVHGIPRILTADGRWAEIRRVYNGGVKRTLRIVTERGYEVEGTLVHPILVNRGSGNEYVPMQEVHIGDMACLCTQGASSSIVQAEIDALAKQDISSVEYARALQILALQLCLVYRRDGGNLSYEGTAPTPGFYDKIVSIEEIGEQQVYDLEINDPSHSFIADGFVNHNTLESIAATTYLFARNPEMKVLVLTKKSVVNQWGSEFEKFTQGIHTMLVKGDKKIRHAQYAEFERMEYPKVMIAGYRSIVQDFSIIQDWKWDVVIMDEATVFKSPNTQTHQICRHIAAQSTRAWGLTGTLIKNNLVEGYGIYKVIHPPLFNHTPAAFVQDYCIVTMQPIGRGRKVPIIQGYRKADIDRFRLKIDPFYLGRPKHLVATELPPLQTKVQDVVMSSFQQTKYQEALAGLLTTGEGEDKEVTKLTAVTYCQEIVNHPGLIGFDREDSGKLDTLIDLLSDGELSEEKVIIYTRFSKMVDIGVAALEEQGIKSLRITGAEDADQRKEAQDTFQDPKSDVKVIWITNAGSDAINLQAAKAVIFYDTPFSAGDYLQILGRMIRIGSVHDRVFAIHLVAPNSIDERVMDVIQRKMKLIESVIGKRLKGEDDTDDAGMVTIEDRSEITDLYDALKRDAQGILLV